MSSRTLILCVDRDDDIGYKANFESPVLGRAACQQAANALGVIDPEDSDVNAIFQAIKTYDDLQEKGENVTVAVVAGNHMNMMEGDRKIASDLEYVMSVTDADSCILVSDGAEDEFIIPIIQSRIPISSIQRVVVNQMPNLEGTYYIIKKLLDDPKVAKTVLVPLGLAMLLFATSNLLGYPEGATIIVVGVLGIYILFKGLGIDEIFSYFLNALQKSLEGGKVTFVSYITAILLAAVGIIMGLTNLLVYFKTGAVVLYLLSFVYGAIVWFTAAGLIASIGKIIDIYLTEKASLGKVIVLPFFITALGAIAYGVSIYTLSISDLPQFTITPEAGVTYIIVAILGGLFCAFFGVYLQAVLTKWMGSKFPVRPQEDL